MSRQTRLRRGAVLALCLTPQLLLALSACDDGYEDRLKLPPIRIRNVVPNDSTSVTDQGGWPLSLDFRSKIQEDELHLEIFPAPDALSEPVLSPSGLTLSYANVDLQDGDLKHKLLIDGPRLVRPRVLEYTVGSPPASSIVGRVSSSKPAVAPVDATIVFAFAEDAEINILAPETILVAEPLTITKVPVASSGTGEAIFAIGQLIGGEKYLLFGINDTNDDGNYDPNLDWWGYHHAEGDLSPFPVLAQAFAELSAEILLGPPGPVTVP